jgi:hypothetical protein
VVGVSAGPAGICVTEKTAIACYAPLSLAPRWRRDSEPDGAWGVSPIQLDDRVLVLGRGRLTAYAAADGAPLWSMDSGQHAHGLLATPAGVLVRNEAYRTELLDPASGEVRAAWPIVAGTLGAAGTIGIIGGMHGSAWSVDLTRAARASRP